MTIEPSSAECPRNLFDARSWWHPPNRTAARGWQQGGRANDSITTDNTASCNSSGLMATVGPGDKDGVPEPTQRAKLTKIPRTFDAEHHAKLSGGGAC
jgi:hypothetical protein